MSEIENVAVEANEVAEEVTRTEEAVETLETAENTARNDRRNRRNGFDRKNNKKFDRNQEKEFEEKVVKINRINKTVKGGRRMRFAALVVVGDKKGRIGIGTGKAKEVPDAIRKATEQANKNIFRVRLVGTTISHATVGEFGAAKVVLRPAADGTGVIAGGPVRAVLELAGVENIISKCLGSRTPINLVRATVKGLQEQKTLESVAALRGKKPTEIRY